MSGSTVEVPLTRGLVAVVDAVDADRVLAHKWSAKPGRRTWYAKARLRGTPRGGPQVLLHRFLLGAPTGTQVDHRNGNGLDCRRENLRLATHAQNLQNRRVPPGRFKGVSWQKNMGKWVARIDSEGSKRILGYFDDPELAARAYDAAAVELYGEFAKLNFPPEAAGV